MRTTFPACSLLKMALAAGLGVLTGLAGAHGLIKTDLGGTVLCLDPASVQAHIHSSDPALDATRTRAIERRLAGSIPRTLAAYHVPYRTETSCQGSDAYVYTLFVADWANDEARPVLNFAASLQVGRWQAPPPVKPSVLLKGNRFDAFQANLLLPSDLATPYYQALPKANEDMARQLALAWLNDAAAAKATHEKRLLITLGVILETLIIAAGVRLWWRRRVRRGTVSMEPMS